MNRWIEFPGLGLKFENVSPIIKIGGFEVYWYGIIISLAFLVGIILILKACRKFGFSQDDIITYVLIAIPSAIVGARLYYVIFSWDSYKNDLSEIFNIRNGGLAIYGGIIAAVISAAIVTKIKKQSFLRILDLAIPYIVLGQAIGRWGNFINQEAYGRQTNVSWRMTGSQILGAVHPDFFYESILCLAIFIFLVLYRKKLIKYNGEILFLYMITYGVVRAFIEYIRGEDALLIGSTDIRVSFILSIVLVITGIIGMIVIRRFPKYKIDKDLLDIEARNAYIKDTGKDPDTGLPIKSEPEKTEDAEVDTDNGSEDFGENVVEDGTENAHEDSAEDGAENAPANGVKGDSEVDAEGPVEVDSVVNTSDDSDAATTKD